MPDEAADCLSLSACSLTRRYCDGGPNGGESPWCGLFRGVGCQGFNESGMMQSIAAILCIRDRHVCVTRGDNFHPVTGLFRAFSFIVQN